MAPHRQPRELRRQRPRTWHILSHIQKPSPRQTTSILVTLRTGWKPGGFSRVTPGDIFSLLRTSYTVLRPKPYAHGGCHSRNYVAASKFATILEPDVAGSYSIPVLP